MTIFVVIIRQSILDYLADPSFELAGFGCTDCGFPVVVTVEVVELGIPFSRQRFDSLLANAINLSKEPHVISRNSHR